MVQSNARAKLKQSARNRESIVFKPQEGPQTVFFSSPADIVFFGGSAGGGKTFAILLEQIRHIRNARFVSIIFRISYAEINNPGGLLDASMEIYPYLGGVFNSGKMTWHFPTGAKVAFRYLESQKDLSKYQGTEVPLINFDELTHFGEREFFYMLSRNRSTSGVRPYIRATMNPDPDSWVAKFVSWYLDEDGFIAPEKSGVIRYFIRLNNEIHWADHPQELLEKFPDVKPEWIKSFTFIRSKLTDNKILLAANPEYLGNLMALPLIDRMRLLEGNWKIRPEAGKVFNRTWFNIIDKEDLPFDPYNLPANARMVRFWDFAATAEEVAPTKNKKKKKPCYTVGTKMVMHAGLIYVLNVIRVRMEQLDDLILSTAKADGRRCHIRWEVEPGSSSIRESRRMQRFLAGFNAGGISPEGDKLIRAKPFSAAVEKGKVYVVTASWNEDWLDELHGCPDQNEYWDQIDSASSGYNYMFDEYIDGGGSPIVVPSTSVSN